MHKTGTTSIQKILRNKNKDLVQLGYLSFINLPKMNAKNKKNFDPAWIREQICLAEKEGIKSIIFSSETISTFNLKQMLTFLDIFSNHYVIVVACFRHWIGFLPSRWAQNCSRRDSQSFPEYINYLKNNNNYESHIDARFDLVISTIEEARPHDIRLISYDNAVATDSLVQIMLSCFDLPKSFVDTQHKKSIYYNSRQKLEITELVRLFNGVYSLKYNNIQNELFESVNHAIPVTEFYDFSKLVIDFLNERNDINTSLLLLLNENKDKILLSPNDPVIHKWESAANKASKKYIYNSSDSFLFDNVLEKQQTCSSLRIEDLPHKLLIEMEEVFN